MAKNEIKATFVLDDAGAKKGVKSVSGELDKLDKSGASVGSSLSGKLGSAFSEISGKGSQAVGSLTSGIGGIALPIAAAGAGIAKFALDGAAKFGTLGQSVEKFSVVAGTSAEQASRFVAVADDYGVSAETLAGAVGKLGKGLGTNAALLDQYGVSIAHAKDGSVDLAETTFNVIDAYNATTDPAKKAALGAAAFGKGYQELIPLIDEGSSKIKNSFDEVSKAQLFDDKKVAEAKKYRLAMDDLHDSVSDLQMTLGQQLVPSIDAVSKAASVGSKGMQLFVEKTGGIGSMATGALNPLGMMGTAIGDVTNKFNRFTDELTNDKNQKALDKWFIQKLDFLPGFAGSADVVVSGMGEVQDAMHKLGSEEQTMSADIAASNEGRRKAVAESMKQVDITGQLTKKYQDQINALHGVQDAMLGQTDATLASQQADLNAADAVDAYTKQLKDNKVSQREHQQAFLDVQGTVNDAAVKYAEYRKGLALTAGAEYTARDAVNAQIDSLQNELAAIRDPALRAAIQAHIDQLRSIPTSIITNVSTVIKGTGGPTQKVAALGGPQRMGEPVVVGELGPEVFVPASNGTIIPNNRLGSGGGSTVTNYVTINVPPGLDAGRVIVEQIAKYERANGASWRAS